MEKGETSQRSGRDDSGVSGVASIVVAMDHSRGAHIDSKRVRLRELRVDAMLGVIIGAIIVLAWVVFDIGSRLNTLAINVNTLTQGVLPQ